MKSKSKSGLIVALTIAVLLVHACAILSSCSGTKSQEKYDGPILKMTLQVDLGDVATRSHGMPADRVLDRVIDVLGKRLENIDINSPKIEVVDTLKGLISMELPAEYVPKNIN